MADDRKPVKISPEVWEQIKDWQNKERKETGVEPTQGNLIEKAWKAFVSTGAPTQAQEPYTDGYAPANRAMHDKLESILNSGDEMTIAAVVPTLDIFFSRLKPSFTRRKSEAYNVCR